jgi:hypothetical protein
MAARNYEDILQASERNSVLDRILNFYQCAYSVFEGLLPEPHNSSILQLLFTLAHWHGLAKLRMHTDVTLRILDDTTTSLGQQLRHFQAETCSAYTTRELKREAAARARQNKSGKAAASERFTKTFNLQTYKIHALGDYVDAIKTYGTTDSYSTEMVGF